MSAEWVDSLAAWSSSTMAVEFKPNMPICPGSKSFAGQWVHRGETIGRSGSSGAFNRRACPLRGSQAGNPVNPSQYPTRNLCVGFRSANTDFNQNPISATIESQSAGVINGH